MTDFGWSYPPGAANDPRAPYNAPDAGYHREVCPSCQHEFAESGLSRWRESSRSYEHACLEQGCHEFRDHESHGPNVGLARSADGESFIDDPCPDCDGTGFYDEECVESHCDRCCTCKECRYDG